MKKHDEIRVSINYFEGYPELEAELKRYPPRVRAERLRLLASMGLQVIKHGLPLAGSGVNEAEHKTGTEHTPQAVSKKRVIAQTFGQLP